MPSNSLNDAQDFVVARVLHQHQNVLVRTATRTVSMVVSGAAAAAAAVAAAHGADAAGEEAGGRDRVLQENAELGQAVGDEEEGERLLVPNVAQ